MVKEIVVNYRIDSLKFFLKKIGKCCQEHSDESGIELIAYVFLSDDTGCELHRLHLP